jgi:hypothetical protein
MKKIIISISIFLASYVVKAQSDTTSIEQYCQIIATPRLLSNKVTIEIDLGTENSFWADNRLRNYDGTLRKFNTIIDAMNFMGHEGWTFINAYPVYNGNTTIYHFAFKKLFPR